MRSRFDAKIVVNDDQMRKIDELMKEPIDEFDYLASCLKEKETRQFNVSYDDHYSASLTIKGVSFDPEAPSTARVYMTVYYDGIAIAISDETDKFWGEWTLDVMLDICRTCTFTINAVRQLREAS